MSQGTCLVIDAGNSRIKWALHAGGWHESGVLDSARVGDIGAAWNALAAPDAVVVANVAGEAVGAALAAALARWPAAPVTWAVARARQAGVTNLYARPEQLGVDRWAALIGAWRRAPGAALVVGVGTACTIDALSARGEFLGGLILPGPALMRRALAHGTAGLADVAGQRHVWPRCTADAIESGALAALAGAIERQYAALAAESPVPPRLLLTGGAAAPLCPLLAGAAESVDNLLLEGLLGMIDDDPV